VASGNVVRGSRIGAGPTGESARGQQAPRQQVHYYCGQGHESTPSFARDAVAPEVWDCVRCGHPASQNAADPPPDPKTEPFKTHLAYVKERRSESDGEALLAEALSMLRERRTL